MENSLMENVLNVCKTPNKHSVEYLIVGGTAVALHGFFRQSYAPSGHLAEKHDLDFWYNSTYDNYFKLLNALEDLGQDVTEFKAQAAPDPKRSFFRIEFDNFTVDLLPVLHGLSKFRSCFDERDTSKIDGTELPFINFDDLIKNKQTQARPKDIEDVKQLTLRRFNPE